MQAPAIPLDEPIRQEAVDRLRLTTVNFEPVFDRATRLLQAVANTPITAFSVLDHDRQFFKSKQGIEARETPRDVSFCGHAILQNDIFVVEDALNDKRFHDNPLVTGQPNVRFYAGIPVHSPTGRRVATLCAIDHVPREFTANMRTAMEDIRGLVEGELVLRSAAVIDQLTGLFNRRYFDEIMQYEWRRALKASVPLALVLMEVDAFTAYNDQHGEDAADEALTRVADILKLSGQTFGHMVGRYTGSQFVLLLARMSADEAEILVNDIRRRIAVLAIPFSSTDSGVLTVSAGIGLAPTIEQLAYGYNALVQDAMHALAAAKAAGGNRISTT